MYPDGSIQRIYFEGVENPFPALPELAALYFPSICDEGISKRVIDRFPSIYEGLPKGAICCKREVPFKECRKEVVKGPDPIEAIKNPGL